MKFAFLNIINILPKSSTFVRNRHHHGDAVSATVFAVWNWDFFFFFLAFLAFLASLISDVTLTALTFITGKCRNREGTFFGSRQNGKVSVPISRLSALP